MYALNLLLAAIAFNPPAEGNWGVLVMAHGGDPAWNAEVEQTVAPLRQKYPTELALGMAQTSTMREAVRKLEERGVERIAVVRMFISGDSFVPATEYILGLRKEPPVDAHASRGYEPATAPADCHATEAAGGEAKAHGAKAADAGHGANHDAHAAHGGDHGGHVMEKPEPIRSKAQFFLSKSGVGESPLVDEILYDRTKALSKEPARESVLILAHGPGHDEENEKWLANMNRRVDQIKKLGPFRAVQCETLREDWPDARVAAEKRIREFVQRANENGGKCIVLPFRVAGFGPYRETLEGLEYVADGRGFCPHPNMTEWIEQTAKEVFQQATTAGTN